MRAPNPFAIFFVLIAFLFLTACGDDVVDGDGDCPDGQILHPVSGTCVTPSSNQTGPNQTDPNQTDPNQTNPNQTNPNNTEQPCGTGRVEGLACTPDGNTLSSASITLSGTDCEGNAFSLETTSDSAGYYTFEDVPAGNQELVVTSGSFSGTRIVQVHPDQTTDLRDEAEKVCVAGDSARIAVIQGTWDDVGSLLDSMDIEYDIVGSDQLSGTYTSNDARNFLTDYNAMTEYDIIFIECGNLHDRISGSMAQIRSNLQFFVHNHGGSLYASDYAYQFIEEPFPDAVNFLGKEGGEDQTVMARVVSTPMLSLLGSSQAEIYFNLDHWVVMASAGPDSVVHFEGDPQLMNGTTHNNAPFLVSFSPPSSSGQAIFTSFHNSAQDGMEGDMEEILRFLIFQL